MNGLLSPWALPFCTILKNFFNKKFLDLSLEITLNSAGHSENFDFFHPCLLPIRGGFGIRNHAGVIFWELKNVFKEPLIKYFSKKLQNEATHAILETVSGSNFYMK